MEPILPPSSMLESRKSPPPRPSAMKRTLSIRSQVSAHVKFAETTVGSLSGPLSPRSPLAERSSPRPEYRVALQRTISSGSISSSSLRHQVDEVDEEEEEVHTPLKAVRINEPDNIPTVGDGYFFGDNNVAVARTEIHVASEHSSTALSICRTIGERSSARVSSPNVQDIEVLQKILDTLREHKIPGPQLFRAQTEFPKVLGFGGEGNVRGTDESINNKINGLDLGKVDKPKWSRFAIKRHGPRDGDPAFKLRNYLAAAEAEISALSHLLRGHRNIVQLRGWGLCLDTLENTQNISESTEDLSSSNLHLPLIILERADGDLKQFLKHVFSGSDGTDVSRRGPESIAEAGLCQTPGSAASSSLPTLSMTPAVPFRPERVSLSGSTLQDNEDEPAMPQRYAMAGSELEGSNHSPEFWIINGMDRHEVLRRLCIDIGHGLQALHDMNMTHGDLKPRNVLVFREGPVWTAKLCDFGHSNDFGHSSSLDSSKDGAPYLGTLDWRPHWFGDTGKKHNIETLKDFDLAVYGALVWSAFSPRLRGEAPPISEEWYQSNPCTLSQTHLEEIAPTGCVRSILGSQAALARRVNRLVQATVCASYLQYKEGDGAQEENPNQRLDKYPWEHLYSHTVRATRSLWSRIPDSQKYARHRENDERNTAETSSETTSSSTIEAPTCCRPKVSSRLRDPRRYQAHHQTSSLLTAGSLCIPAYHGTAALYPEMSNNLDDLTSLYNDMHHLIPEAPKDPTKHALLLEKARLRVGKGKLASWSRIQNRRNIVKLALTSVPPLDIYTIAWLCRGEVGTEEVRGLPAQYSIWKIILDPGVLNDSERLELFLLLMKFGARMEQTLDDHPAGEPPRSILSTYLHSCRLATRAVVANEICRHYGRILADESKPHKPNATRYYMTAGRGFRPKGMNDDRETIANSTALGNIELDWKKHRGAYPFLKLNFEQLLDEQNDIYQVRMRRPSCATDERTPLLSTHFQNLGISIQGNNTTPTTDTRYLENSDFIRGEGQAQECNTPHDSGLPLPTFKPSSPGWSECGGAFINELTRSITLKRPTVKLEQLRHVSIGHIGSASVLEIDMADFMLPRDRSSSSEPEENSNALRQRIKKRFPLFDEAWFSTELPPNDNDNDDVLAALKDDSKWDQEPTSELSSAFEIKPPNFSIEAFLSRNFSTLLFFVQYPTAALGLLWELVIWLHDQAGAPIVVAFMALTRELKSLDTARRPLLSLLRWAPMVFGRIIVLLLAGLVCLLGAALVVAIVLAFMLG
ncbi:hypothetical protein F5Y10DRAFT_294192 [Nemania abortiva]|nr:hypothetical protein F5Y10DRAFT_294192 [Nemania abortiva]